MVAFSAALRLHFSERIMQSTELINYIEQKFLEELIVARLVPKSEGSVPYSQELATDPYLESGEPSPHPTFIRPKSNNFSK
jgi:hypothetical protein